MTPTVEIRKAEEQREDLPNVDLLDPGLHSEVDRALSCAKLYAFNNLTDESHWYGELLSNVTITAEHVMFYQTLGLDLSADSETYKIYLLSQQRPDGSWAIAPGHHGDVSTSSEAYLALKILGMPIKSPEMQRARNFILQGGGIAKVRVISRVYFAQFGLFPWKAIPQLPAEFYFLPSQVPINLYTLSSWARSLIVPLLIIRHHEPIHALPNGRSASNDFLDELWLDPSEKMVPYGPTLTELWNNDTLECFFGVVDKLLGYLGGLRGSPLRTYARRQCVDWILQHQEREGDWAGIIPPMHAGVQALLLEGLEIADPRIQKALAAIERFAWQDEKHGKRIQACVSPVWDTVLMARGICDAGMEKHNDERALVRRAIDWCKARQQLGPEGDWRVYNAQAVGGGGFSFEYNNSWYPDVDDTAAAILAFVCHDKRSVTSPTVQRAAEWILGMQNKDGGWAAFDVGNDKLFLNKIPFCDMNNLCDPSTADVTGRILEAFGLMLQTSNSRLHGEQEAEPDRLPLSLYYRLSSACRKAIAYLSATQTDFGAWYGRWGVNYIYGTSNALCGLAYFSSSLSSSTVLASKEPHNPASKYNSNISSTLAQTMVARGTEWLRSVQNPIDGGWGEGLESYTDTRWAGKGGVSTPSQTAWALMGLLAGGKAADEGVKKGVSWLVRSQQGDERHGKTWDEAPYTATGFPGHFYLNYTLYRHYFPLMALGRYKRALEKEDSTKEKRDRGEAK
ncbi:hypothetical protein ACLMJK_002224 [Lecanora helva]